MTDREKLIELLCSGTLKTEICTTETHMECEPCRGDCGYCTILADYLLANGVTVQKHGRWEDKPNPQWRAYDIRYCSVCGWSIHKTKLRNADLGWRFCPNCGADMRGE